MDDDDLWGPPLVVQDDTLRKQTLRGCEFWFDCRTDVLEEHFQNEKYCKQVWRILNEKKHDAETNKLEKDSVSLHNDLSSSGRSNDSHDTGGRSTDSDKTLSDTSSEKSALADDENTSSISDAQTTETRDSSNRIEDIDPDTRLKPQEKIAVIDPLTVAGDADTSSGPVLASKIDDAEEHSCSSLVTDQVFDPIKQAPANKSSSAISRENTGGSTLRPLLLETSEKMREKASDTNEDGEVLKDHQQRDSLQDIVTAISLLKDHQQRDSLQDIVTASEPFTTESLLEMCDEPDKGRETTPCDERSKRSPHPEAVKTVVVKEELIMNFLTEAKQKAEKNPGSVLIKKRQSTSNSSDKKGMNTSFIRNTKQKLQGEAGEKNIHPVKNTIQSTPEKIIMGSSVKAGSAIESIVRGNQGSEQIVNVSGISITELRSKTAKDLRSIAKEQKLTGFSKLKKEDLLRRIIKHLIETNQLCTKQITEL